MTMTCLTMMALSIPASALTYDFAGADQALFGSPTSVDPVTVVPAKETKNINRSKDSAFIPPTFGAPSADTPGTGSLLTPNLSGVAPMQLGSDKYTWNGSSAENSLTAPGGSDVIVMPPSVNGAVASTGNSGGSTTPSTGSTGSSTNPSTGSNSNSNFNVTSKKNVTAADLKREDGSIGTLKMPTINVSVKVYDGTTDANMKKGATHFTETSYWDGNVAMAAHNRNSYFGKIYKLRSGDKITYETNLGTRTYAVESVYTIDDDDTSCLNDSNENRLTLVTCVENQSAYRWCVIAKEIS